MALADATFAAEATPGAPSAGMKAFCNSGADNRPHVIKASGEVVDLSGPNKYNFIRNSGFWFAQRQAPGTLTTITASTTARNPGPDGWGVTNANADTQYNRTNTGAAKETGLQGKYYGNFKKITSTGKQFYSQMLEGQDCQALRGRTVRFQCWMKGSTAITAKMAVIQLNSSGTEDTMPASFMSALGADNVDPTLGTNLAFIAPLGTGGVPATPAGGSDNVTIGANAASCAVTTAWQRFGFCVTLPTDYKNLIVMIWTDVGPVANVIHSIAQVSLTDGYDIQDWQPLPMSLELARCQRYFAQTANMDQVLGATALGINTGEAKGIVGKAAAANGDMIFWRFPVEMRAAPTVTGFNPATNSSAHVRQITQAADASAGASITVGSTQSCKVIETSPASSAVGDEIGIHLTADAKGSNNEFC